MSEPTSSPPRQVKVVVATSVMLSFISFWRAAAIVLSDLGSSAFYVGGIAEKAVGKSAPWFILGVMLFSYAVRAVYIESCSMFTRGGVYRVVKEAMGGVLAKLSVSALIFDYILTGPISGVSAGQYIVGLFASGLTYFGHPWSPAPSTVNLIAAAIAVLITLYFWWRNTQGIHESSDDALRIMAITTVMAVLLIGWCGLTIAMDPGKQRLPPAPIPSNLHFNEDAVGWLPKLAPSTLNKVEPVTPDASGKTEVSFTLAPGAGSLIGLIGLLIAFGHSFLAMSGEESLAQVNRELEHPKHENLMRAGLVIFVYSLLFTSLVSFFAYSLIPDEVRPKFTDNLIAGITSFLVGPVALKLLFQAFVVLVGFLILAGAINTSIIGANGVLNRVSEDGVMPDWFRQPHHRFGTSYRIINLIVGLQLIAILASRGETYVLGEAYAFGVIWSFAFKGLAMLLLRFKDKTTREWKVPLNIRVGSVELPLGLALISAVLFAVAIINLFTKQVATISGVAFTIAFFLLFLWSEHLSQKKRGHAAHVELEQFRLQTAEEVSNEILEVRPGNTLVVVRDYNTLDHLRHVINRTDTDTSDIVVMTVHVMKGPDAGYRELEEKRLFTSYEQMLFTRVLSMAEKAGKPVHLAVVPSTNIFDAIMSTAARLVAHTIVMGRSSTMTPDQQAQLTGQAWERLPKKPRHVTDLRVVDLGGKHEHIYHLGAHAPDLSSYEIEMIHRLWLEMTCEPGLDCLHHRDVVALSLMRLGRDLKCASKSELLDYARTHYARGRATPVSDPPVPEPQANS